MSRSLWFSLTVVTSVVLSAGLSGCGGGDAAAPQQQVNGGVNQMGTAAGVAMPGMETTSAARPTMPAPGGPGMAAHGGGGANPNMMPATPTSAHDGAADSPLSNPAALAGSAHRGAGAGADPTQLAGASALAGAADRSSAHDQSSRVPGAIAGAAAPSNAHGGATAAPGSIPGANTPTPGAAHGVIGLNGLAGASGAPGATDLAGTSADGLTVPGSEGVAGGEQPPPVQEFPVGTPQHPVQQLIKMAKAGDYTGASEIISDRAKALAATIRDDKLTDAQKESFKTSFDNLTQSSSKAVGPTGGQVTFRNPQSQFVAFTIAKEGDVFRIRELSIREGTKR